MSDTDKLMRLRNQVQRERDEAVINGTFDRFLKECARVQARWFYDQGDHELGKTIYDKLSVETFELMLVAYMVYPYLPSISDNIAAARDYFEREYRLEYLELLGWPRKQD